jgi:SH3-like domain-containing protein
VPVGLKAQNATSRNRQWPARFIKLPSTNLNERQGNALTELIGWIYVFSGLAV